MPAGTNAALTSMLVARLVSAAVAAPSMLNSQPWRFVARLADRSIDVYADPARNLRHADPYGRGLHLACGAAVFNLRLASAVTGTEPVTRLVPRANHPLLLATVRLAGHHRPQMWERELYAAIWRRHTSRWPLTGRPVPGDLLAALAEAAATEGAQLRALDHAEAGEVLALSAAADARLLTDPGYRAELAAWAGWTGNRQDGIPAAALGPPPAGRTPPVRDLAAVVRAGTPAGHRTRFERQPQLAIILAPSDTPADWLRAGQALQRVLLLATTHGLVTSPHTPALEAMEPPLRRDLPSHGGHPVMIVRLGYGKPGIATPRRPVSDVLRISQEGSGREGEPPGPQPPHAHPRREPQLTWST